MQHHPSPRRMGHFFLWAMALLALLAGHFLLLGTRWVTSTLRVSLREMLYALTAPLQGTGSGVMGQILTQVCLPLWRPAAAFALWQVVLHTPLYRRALVVLNKLTLRYGKTLPKGLYAFPTLQAWGRRLLAGACALCLLVGTAVTWQQLEVGDYLRSVSQQTDLYEQYYVSPKTVAVKAPEKKPNLVVIYLEAMDASYSGEASIGGKQQVNYLPALTQLAMENTAFLPKDGQGGLCTVTGTSWTIAAILASTAGLPYAMPVEGNNMSRYANFMPGVTTLGDMLAAEGYRLHFLCGSDANFAGRRAYFTQHGGATISDLFTARERGVIPPGYYVWWGFEDKILFQMAREELTAMAVEDTPFCYTMLTVDTHFPEGYRCDLCPDTTGHTCSDIVLCADRQVSDFLNWCSAQSWYEDTVFLITGDHCRMDGLLIEDIPMLERPLYHCFLNARAGEVPLGRTATMMDLFPTTLVALGFTVEGDRLGLGTNLFSKVPTLAEAMGLQALNEELKKSSDWYVEMVGK